MLVLFFLTPKAKKNDGNRVIKDISSIYFPQLQNEQLKLKAASKYGRVGNRY